MKQVYNRSSDGGSNNSRKKKLKTSAIIARITLVLVVIALIVAAYFVFFKENNAADDKTPPKDSGGINGGTVEPPKKPTEIIEPTVKYPLVEVENNVSYIRFDEKTRIIIVNKQYTLPKDYGDGLTEDAQKAADDMFAAASKDGIYLYIGSGFRSYSTQESIFNNFVSQLGFDEASKISAEPGHSEHQSGLAMDLGGATPDTFLRTVFSETVEYAWLTDHADDYGFIERYPNGKTDKTGYDYEPWHYRYVGVELAQKIKASGLCLEEYAGI
ncbi:MAG: M15 family metallopeptidase [Oscillospiraceae bacterium]